MVSYEAFCAQHTDDLLRLALLLTGSEADAQDATQDALERAFKSWDRVSAADSPYAYVRTMVVNASRSWWRRTRSRETPVAGDLDPGGLAAQDPAQVADAFAVWGSCLALPHHQKVAVVLRFYEDLSYAEIADATGCAESTARTRVFRGLDRMRQDLGEEER